MQSVLKIHAELHNTDDYPANDIDESNEHAGSHVALHELSSTVHSAVKIRFTADIFPLLNGFFFRNKPGIQIRFNRYLLAGHGVQSKTGGNFRNTRRTGSDDDFI